MDDDTYVNLPALLQLLGRFNHSRPLVLGHVLNGVWDRGGALRVASFCDAAPLLRQIHARGA